MIASGDFPDLGAPSGFVNGTPCSSYYGEKTALDMPKFQNKPIPYAVCGYTPNQLRGAYGVTDELCQRPLENPVSVSDFHATIYAALGIDPDKSLAGGPRPVPITDGGRPIRSLFA